MKPPPAAGSRRLDMVDVDELVAADRNPKDHDLPGIAGSFVEFGMTDLVVLDERTGRLVSGHGRTDATRLMRDRGDPPPDGVRVVKGTWNLPVIRGWRSTDDEHAAGALLSSNRWGERGGWHPALLAEVIADLTDRGREELLLAAGYDELDQYDILNAAKGDPRYDGPPGSFPPVGEVDAEYRCPLCRHEWNGDPRPA